MIIGPKIYGLVLAGGKSSRMGKDKGMIPYHGMPQREYLYHLLSRVCEETFVSIRPDQKSDFPEDMQSIVDDNTFKGPYNGMLSAHNTFPEVAWLVLACDLPLLDLASLQELIAARDPNVMATTFAQKEDPLPEPLCAIWEPHAFESSKTYLESGNGTCPRKFLINNETKLVIPSKANVLLNANSEEEYKEAIVRLTIE
ncbi:molybdopterin-guanine dinucleotide biosynthesis protein A [Pricia antarctica]|uniref:Probable molybdenum cofactor guanylyltransferase n=1 Tax=Pricia antarctica TaxID=641691 RepID=A0A1G7E667_9FLAO|nr:NTP transferase domain-containing protein [Pricia antarctica]SDE59177.1 molybdopterin-guanine dinucleotide biosynthesis protein A [Pricia antarctica]